MAYRRRPTSRDENPIPSTPERAKSSAMWYLGRRDHSEKELRDKLSRRYETAHIDVAIAFVRDHGWMPEAAELSRRLSVSLDRQKKGLRAINNKLRMKGLPPVTADPDRELEKALQLAETKLRGRPATREEKARIGRFLVARGFDSDTIRKVLYEKL